MEIIKSETKLVAHLYCDVCGKELTGVRNTEGYNSMQMGVTTVWHPDNTQSLVCWYDPRDRIFVKNYNKGKYGVGRWTKHDFFCDEVAESVQSTTGIQLKLWAMRKVGIT